MTDRDYLRIATEGAFAPPELVAEWQAMLNRGDAADPGFVSQVGFYMTNHSERARFINERLQDPGRLRLADMDAAGIDRQPISLTCPGVQAFDTDRAIGIATLASDQLAEACRRHPERFAGLTAVAPQDPARAAKEIDRGHTELGLHGVIINSHTRGEYLDDTTFWPIFEAAEALGTPIYLHLNTPSPQMIAPLRPARQQR